MASARGMAWKGSDGMILFTDMCLAPSSSSFFSFFFSLCICMARGARDLGGRREKTKREGHPITTAAYILEETAASSQRKIPPLGGDVDRKHLFDAAYLCVV